MKLTEEELFRGLSGVNQEIVPVRPEMKGVHGCLNCKLALIPDSSSRQLCYFCSKTKKEKHV